jgi:ElaB/YqjD/DUF883 family membrane-anchored ribosome-binding protein
MNETNAVNRKTNDPGTLAEDAQDLINATAGMTGEKVAEARRRLSLALEKAKEIAGRVRDKAVQGAKATDEAVHEHPYQAMAIALTLGAVIGFLAARHCSSND